MGEKILIIEDDGSVIMFYKQILEPSGYKVNAICSSENEIQTSLNAFKPDLIIVDVSEEEKKGRIDIANKITERLDIPHIFITGNLSEESFQLVKESLPAGFLKKPINEKELISVIEIAFFQKEIQKKKEEEEYNDLKFNIVFESSENVFNYISSHVNLRSRKIIALSTGTHFNINRIPDSENNLILNLKKINNIKHVNKFFHLINSKLIFSGIFIGCVETKDYRKMRKLKAFPPGLNYIYYTLDFIFMRVFPKLPLTKKIYFFVTNGKNRVLSRAETLGRLYSSGFKVVSEEVIDNRLYFISEKVKEPVFGQKPSYGPIFRMRRIGKNGKIIHVYKLRTMHPYAEFLQEYIYQKHKLEKGGKIKDDFRISTLGKFFRKFWLDELPMLLNLLKGDLKIVGVRPLSEHYLSLYPDEHKKFRMRFRPGLIPPFYYDLPKTLEEIVESERKYLLLYKRFGFITDIRYFFRIMYNILIKKARSR